MFELVKLHIRLTTPRTSASMAAEQSTKAQTGVVHSLNDSHKAIVAAHKAVVEIEPITRSNNNILTRLSKLVTQSVIRTPEASSVSRC